MILSKVIKRFLLIFLLAGILGGAIFGFLLSLCVFGLIYRPELCIFFSMIISLFYIPGVWRAIKNKTYPVIIRKLFEIVFFASVLNAMFLIEEGIIEFNSFDWYVVYICVGLVIILMTTFIILESYFAQSWLFREINHIINGMQIYGLLPNEENEEKEEKKK